nr:lycopene cyclase family protein [Cytophagales bacterium]
MNNATAYDYIIAGGGMAGLSLAYYMSQSEKLRQCRVLIVDKEQKNRNDRTWCFWERGEKHPLEGIVYRKWRKLDFFGIDFTHRYQLRDHVYKMIRGIDFYEFMHRELNANPNVRFLYASIEQVQDTPDGATVTTDQGTYTARYAFDSTFRPDFQTPGSHFLLQHFKGWVMTTPTPQFDPDCATLQDFRIEQHG